MKELHNLHNAFKLPEECRNLGDTLHRWREEVQSLFPPTHLKTTADIPSAFGAASTLEDTHVPSRRTPPARRNSSSNTHHRSLQLISHPGSRRNHGVRVVDTSESLVNFQSWNNFYSSTKAVATCLNLFSSAIHYVSDFRPTQCNKELRELERTLKVRRSTNLTTVLLPIQFYLKEIYIVLNDEIKLEGAVLFPPLSKHLGTLKSNADHDAQTSDEVRDPAANRHLRHFVRVRLDVCREQFKKLKESIKDYQHSGSHSERAYTEIFITHFRLSSRIE